MKKILTTIAISTIALSSISISNAAEDAQNYNQNANHEQQHKPRNLQLTQDQAKQLVTSEIIKHNRSETDEIKKVETVTLSKDRTFYLVYVGEQGQDTNLKFFVVDAQRGKVDSYPSHPHHKHRGFGHNHNQHQPQPFNLNN